MRRTLFASLASVLVMGLVVGVAVAADSPFEGTWKVLIPQGKDEVSAWLIKVDKEGKAVEIVAGVSAPFKSAAVKDLKINAKRMHFALAVPKGQTFNFDMVPPSADDKETLRGCVRFGPTMLPVWMEKTEQTEIDPKTAKQQVGAFGDLEAALKKTESEEKLKELAEVAKSHLGRPVGVLSHTLRLNELMRTKAKTQAFRAAAKDYVEGMKGFGPHMVFATHLNLCNALRGNPETLPVSLEMGKAALALLSDDFPKNLHLTAMLSLSTSLFVDGKKEEADKFAAKMKPILEDMLKQVKEEEGKVIATRSLAQTLLRSPAGGVADLGLQYAVKARSLLKKDAPAPMKLDYDKFLRSAYASRGKNDEAAKLNAVIEKVENDLDDEYTKKSIPFEVKKFAGRKGKSQRVVLVELFTGAQCLPCISADIAFDAAAKAYTSKELVLMQYHLHNPGPDPLTNPDSEARQRFYGEEDAGGTPALFVDGKSVPELGGNRGVAEDRFDKLSAALNLALEVEQEATIKLSAKRTGSKIELKADVSGISAKAKNVKLRFVLLEEQARFTGRNGQRLHHNVVRSMPGGASGFAIEKKEATQSASVDLDEVRKSLNAYLTGVAKKNNYVWPERPMNLKKLKVVAFLQDDDSKKVLQAAIVPVD